MSTRRFATDKYGRKFYIGDLVEYDKNLFLVEDMNFLSWNREQYLTLRSKKNDNKLVEFIHPLSVCKSAKVKHG